jgi:hypothetical protein
VRRNAFCEIDQHENYMRTRLRKIHSQNENLLKAYDGLMASTSQKVIYSNDDRYLSSFSFQRLPVQLLYLAGRLLLSPLRY